jgi:HEAT repeat protein
VIIAVGLNNPALPASSQTDDAENVRKVHRQHHEPVSSQEGGVRASVGRVANFLNPWSDEWAEIVIEPGTAVDPSVIAALRKRMEDPDATIQIKSCRALGILKSAHAIPSIMTPLQRESTNPLRFEAIRSLRKIGDPARQRVDERLSYSDVKVKK